MVHAQMGALTYQGISSTTLKMREDVQRNEAASQRLKKRQSSTFLNRSTIWKGTQQRLDDDFDSSVAWRWHACSDGFEMVKSEAIARLAKVKCRI